MNNYHTSQIWICSFQSSIILLFVNLTNNIIHNIIRVTVIKYSLCSQIRDETIKICYQLICKLRQSKLDLSLQTNLYVDTNAEITLS